MKIEYIEWKNFLSNNQFIKINFKHKYYEIDHKKYFDKYIFDHKRSDVKSQEGILKTLALVGKNASYKTSILKSAFEAVNFIANFKFNVRHWEMSNINFNKVLVWYKQKYNQSLWDANKKENKSYIGDVMKEYLEETRNIDRETLIKKYLTAFYNKYAFHKKEPLMFAVNFVDTENKNYLYNVVFQKNQDNQVDFMVYLNEKEVDLVNHKQILKTQFSSFDMPAEIKNHYLEENLNYLYFKKFNQDKDKLINLLKLLDPSIDGIKIKTFGEARTHFLIKAIEREYNGVHEDISLSQLSSGTKTFIFYLSTILQNDFIVIDEIEQSLHKKLIDLLLDIARQNNKQILFSTHSPTVISTNLKMYEFYILNWEEKIEIKKANDIFRQDKDNFLQKYLKDLVSSIDDVDIDFIRMYFY